MDFEVRHIDGTTVKLISSEHVSAITSATQTRKLCGNDTVTINLQSATYIDFYVGDKITIFGTTYTLNQLPTVKKESERSYTYTLVFEGLQYTLIDRVFLMPDNTAGDNLMFDLAGMLDVLDDNINRGNSGKQYEFVLDESLEETEYKNLSLTGKNCLQVLQQLCQEWDTEFVFAEEPTRIAIYIGVAGSTFAFPFTYGRGGGVYELNREKGASDICTRLFVYGGTQNLTYYRHNRLCLPSKEKNQSYVEDATAQAVYGIKEQVKNFDDIYPNRIGTITSLSGCDYNEFIDSAMADAEFGFDLNEKWANNADDCAEWLALKGLEDTPENEAIYYNDVAGTATKYLMAGATAKIHFNTGALAGYECDLHSYTHSSQKFVLKPLVDENGYDFPSKTNAAFKLAVGDEYVILDINLPTAYKEEAESKLATEAASYFDTVCRPQPKYTLTIEPIALKHIVGPSTADTEIFKVGDLINISDPTGGVESATIRIDQFVRNLLDPFDYKLTLTDEITYSQQVRTLIEVDAIKRVVEESKIYDVNRIRRGWKDAEELYNQMFDTEGHYYSEKIAPLSIDTQMLKVGARSQQLVLQNVLFQPNYNADPANLQISAGSLVHYTIAEPDIKTWTMSALSASNVPSTAQYVYAKCAKNGTTGTWLVTDEAIVFDSELYPNDYHFLVGSLSSVEVVDGVSQPRNFAATYGFTTINGRNITTGVIRSSDGSSVIIDLDAGIIKGNITFEAGTTSYGALQDIISDNDTVQGAVTIANRAEGKIDGLEIGGRNLVFRSAIMPYNNTGGLGINGWRASGGTATHKDYNNLPNPNWTGAIRVTNGGSSAARIGIAQDQITVDFKNGEYLTISYYIRASVTISQKPTIQPYYKDSSHYANANSANIDSITTEWQLCKGTAPIVGDYSGTASLGYVYVGNVPVGEWVEVCGMKVEKGNKATDWSPAPEDTEAELTALQTDLQTQIDNKIETWSQVADPSTAWTSTELKYQHVNDLWYYTGESTDTRTNNKTYKYTKSGSTYSWTEHSAGGGDLFNKIKGKSTIYYNSTESGYNPEGVQDGDFLLISSGANQGKSFRRLNNAWVSVQDYQTAIANIEIGGRNLLLNSADEWVNDATTAAWKRLSISTTPLEIDGNYIISFDAKTSNGTDEMYVALAVNDTSRIVKKGIKPTTTYARYVVSIANSGTYSSAINSVVCSNHKNYQQQSSNNGTLYIKNFKLEKGNKATDWSPAPEDTDAAISAVADRLDNIDDNDVFSMAEKQAFRTEWYAISGNADTTSAMGSDGSAYRHYNSINSAATKTRNALSTAFSALRTYLNTCGLFTDEDYVGFSQADLRTKLAAYYNAEMDCETYLENVTSLTGSCSTASGTATKYIDVDSKGGVVTADMVADMLADPTMRMSVVFYNENTSQNVQLLFRLGGSNVTPTGTSSANCYLVYGGAYSNQNLYFVQDLVMDIRYDQVYNGWVRFKIDDEENVSTVVAFTKAIRGKTTQQGGLIITETIVSGEGSGQAGMSGENASGNVAFWAGGQIGSAQNFGVPVVIMRDGQAKLGLLRVSKMGDITMPDDNGYSRFSILNKAIPTVGSSAVLNNSYNYTNSTDVAFTAETTSQTEWQDPTIGNNGNVFGNYLEMAAIHAGAPLTLQNSSGKTEFTLTIDSGVHCFVSIYLRIEETTDHRITNVLLKHIDNGVGAAVYTTYNYDTFDNRQVLLPSGQYLAKIVCVYNLFRIDSSAQYGAGIAISGLEFRANAYHDATVPQTTIGNNGLFVNANATNYLMIQSLNQVLTFKLHGNTDIPGVLWAGRITSTGSISSTDYNCVGKSVASQRTATGTYKLTLSGFSASPTVLATIVNTVTSSPKGCSANVQSYSSSQVVIRTFSDNTLTDFEIHVVIFGKN